MTQYALFKGCNIPARVIQYADASIAVLAKVGVETTEIPEFNCCGYPMRNTDRQAFILSAARNLAIAQQAGSDMLVLCKCCFGSLKAAQYILDGDTALKAGVNQILMKENLQYDGGLKVLHLLSVLHNEVGIKALKETVSARYKKLNIAVHHGCHALRPSKITEFDDPAAPVMFDALVKLTGAKSVDWGRKLDCCGAPSMGANDALAADMMSKKVASALDAGADYLCTACPYCHIQFDTMQAHLPSSNGNEKRLAPILYPQLLGISMGIAPEILGIDLNTLNINTITNYLKAEKKNGK